MPATAQRNTVFISYSHRDREWLERLQVHLKPLERAGLVQRWDDTMIRPGQTWRQEINQALRSARVAVLLISADFLASDFIADNELPPLLQRHENDGAIILPLILSPSRFGKTPSLVCFQAVNPPTQPLIALPKAEQEAILVGLTEAIEAALGAGTDSTTPATDRPAESETTVGATPVSYSGQTKLAFCRRLGDSWRHLADILDIPPDDQARFDRGDEARAIWNWLDFRTQLGRLPQACEEIDRPDLVEELRTRPR